MDMLLEAVEFVETVSIAYNPLLCLHDPPFAVADGFSGACPWRIATRLAALSIGSFPQDLVPAKHVVESLYVAYGGELHGPRTGCAGCTFGCQGRAWSFRICDGS